LNNAGFYNNEVLANEFGTSHKSVIEHTWFINYRAKSP
jgi:hypothetical protein